MDGPVQNAQSPVEPPGTAPELAPAGLEAAERWLAARSGWAIAALLAISATLRVVYWLQLQGGPLMLQHRWDQSDMSHFHAWATSIAGGDWLSAESAPPFHAWHRIIAEEHFRLRPDDRAAIERHLADAGTPLDESAAARALWDRWCGGGRFYQDPLYPYLVAASFSIFGERVGPVFAWQLLLGALTNLLIFLVARRCFGALVATVAGGLAALNGPLMFFEMVLLRDSAIVFAGLLVVWLAGRALDRPTVAGWGLCGLAAGLAMALKVHFLVLLAIIAGGLAAAALSRRRPRAAAWCLPLLAGALAGFGPVLARDLWRGVSPQITGGTPTFVIANGARASGTNWDVRGAAAVLGESDGRFLPSVIGTIGSHPGPGSFLGLLGRKIAALWHWYELPNNENFYYYRLHAPVLAMMPVTFRLVAPLGLVGLILALSGPRLRRCWPLLGLIVVHAAVLVAILPFSRYRIPFVAALIPFAALSTAMIAGWLLRRRWLAAGAALAALVLVALWTARPLPADRTLVRPVDCGVPIEIYWGPMIEASDRAGDWNLSAAVVAEILRYQPRVVRRMRQGEPARNRREAALARFFAELYLRRAMTLELAGRADEAEGPRALAETLGRAASSGG